MAYCNQIVNFDIHLFYKTIKTDNTMVSHEIDYKIFGDDIQFVEIELDPNETVIAEAGTMVYMEQGITFEVKMGDGSTPNQGLMGKLLSAGSRTAYRGIAFHNSFYKSGL